MVYVFGDKIHGGIIDSDKNVIVCNHFHKSHNVHALLCVTTNSIAEHVFSYSNKLLN